MSSAVELQFERLPYLGLLNVPLALDVTSSDAIDLLTRGVGGAAVQRFHRAIPQPGTMRSGRDVGYDVLKGVAVIRISGLLVQKLGCMRPVMGMTGYDGIRLAFRNALRDKGVQAIVLDIDSPGGEVAGCFDLVDDMYRVRGTKPVRAILTENALSAAYALASTADRIIVPRTGRVGSIGIIVIRLDCSRAFSKAGVAINVIKFGARKADHYSELPLSKQGRARFQRDVDTIGNLFVNTVARNRRMKPAAILATEARTFLGAEGLKAGLVDSVAPADVAFNELLASLKIDLSSRMTRASR